MKKLLSLVLVFALMLTLTACGEGDWRETLQEFEVFIEDYVKVMRDYAQNPNDETLKQKVAAMQEEVDEWDAKIKKIGEELEGTADEDEFKAKQMELYTKLLQSVVVSSSPA